MGVPGRHPAVGENELQRKSPGGVWDMMGSMELKLSSWRLEVTALQSWGLRKAETCTRPGAQCVRGSGSLRVRDLVRQSIRAGALEGRARGPAAQEDGNI